MGKKVNDLRQAGVGLASIETGDRRVASRGGQSRSRLPVGNEATTSFHGRVSGSVPRRM